MNVGSLFSGVGGLELGFKWEGYETLWFVEREPYCQSVLKQHWPDAEVYDDVTTIDFASLPRVDVLTGGFPCQDISNAGKRAGIEGSRSSLWSYYCEAIRILRPRIAVIENVSALLNRGLDVVLSSLAEIGYDAEWYCFPASGVGALHRRDRIFIICYANNDGQFTSEEREGVTARGDRDTARTEQACQFTRPNIEHEDVADSKCRRWYARNKREHYFYRKRTVCADKQKNRHQIWRKFRHGRCIYSKNENVSNTLRKRLQRYRAKRIETKNRVRKEHSCRSSKTKPCSMERGWWAVEPELGRVAHGIPNRAHRIKALGNAVVPQVAQAIAKAVKGEKP